MIKNNFILSLLVLIMAGLAHAETLTNEQVFHRCYAHITQSSSYENPTLRAAVINGTTDPIDACMQVLNGALLTSQGSISGSTQITNRNNSEAVKVLQTFHELHLSWESIKTIDGSIIQIELLNDILDNSTPSFYFTKALLDPNTPIDYVLTTDDELRAVREEMNPVVGANSRAPATAGDYRRGNDTYVWNTEGHMFQQNTQLAPIGTLYGFYDAGPMPMTIVATGATWPMNVNYGGGIMGTTAYLAKNVDYPVYQYRANGSNQMPRKWARAIFKDLLCRDLPVARDVDAEPYVVSNGPNVAPFRVNAACTKCHLSMDTMASTIRGLLYRYEYQGGHDLVVPYLHGSPSSTAPIWSPTPISNHWSTTPAGRLVYRSYDGTLHDEPVSNLADLGARLANKSDFYVCAAKRYYEYFTGISVDLGDLGDPTYGKQLDAQATYYRNRVINLGLDLMNHKDPLALVEDILRLPDYRNSDYLIQ